MPIKPRAPSSWVRLSSIGFEVAATVAGLALVGYWFDRHYKSAPWGLLVGSVLGLVGGLYSLVRGTILADRESGSGSAPSARPPRGPTAGDPKP